MMQGHRVRLGSSENDFTGKSRAPYYGHKAGGATVYVKRLSNHKERRMFAADLREQLNEIGAEVVERFHGQRPADTSAIGPSHFFVTPR